MTNDNQKPESTPIELTDLEEASINEQADPRLPVVYEIVRRQGAHELGRPTRSLWWSGIAAGICIGLSVLSQALLALYMPDVTWAVLIEKFGYCVGFIVVILAGQQLFTENTITAVAPVIAEPSQKQFWRLIRLWAIVFVANLVGAIVSAWFLSNPYAIAPELSSEIAAISQHALHFGWGELIWRGAFAGFMIATLVWMLARSERAHFMLIVLVTYLIALGDFAHIVAGSVEAAYLVLTGGLGIASVIFNFMMPTLLGNVIGGTLLFTMLAYGQIAEEMRDTARV